ncbi:hypothetical protein BaRGS_00000550 [Batillaria attramentaria]|uniref:Uncharacterized protein n=1 Tax=Batillaria attramentaria TaxID=370345 RepID=A0ABD0MAB4_9CAEN
MKRSKKGEERGNLSQERICSDSVFFCSVAPWSIALNGSSYVSHCPHVPASPVSNVLAEFSSQVYSMRRSIVRRAGYYRRTVVVGVKANLTLGASAGLWNRKDNTRVMGNYPRFAV